MMKTVEKVANRVASDYGALIGTIDWNDDTRRRAGCES